MALNIQLDESKLAMVQNLEVEMMADMYNRMTDVCQQKCIPSKYLDGELTKGEGVCIDRCVAKYLEVHDRIGQKLQAIQMQEQEQAKKLDPQPNEKTAV